MRLESPSRARPLRALLVLSIVGLAACSSSTAPATTAPTATAVATIGTPAATPESASPPSSSGAAPSIGDLGGATAVPTSLDPCQVISAAEAGTLAGATFGAGKESTTSGNARICTYGGATPNVFMFEIAIAPDAATAQADETAALADLDASASQLAGHGVTTTKIPGFAPGADAVLGEATISAGGITVGGRAIYVLRGTTFFGFSDIALGTAPASADAMKTEAMLVLGRLP
jgi:hypothetical protein